MAKSALSTASSERINLRAIFKACGAAAKRRFTASLSSGVEIVLNPASPLPTPVIDSVFNESRWFAEYLLPHESMLRAWLHGRVQSRHEIDDIVQEAYIRVLRARTRGELGSPKAFLFATARNLAIDLARHGKVTRSEPLVESDALAVLDEREDIPETIARNQELAFLTEAIQSLPDRCRQVFTLRKVYGLSQKEIAQKLGISEHTVSAQLTIGIHKCTEYVLHRRDQRGMQS